MYVNFNFKELSYIDLLVAYDLNTVYRRQRRDNELFDMNELLRHERFMKHQLRIDIGESIRHKITESLVATEELDFNGDER